MASLIDTLIETLYKESEAYEELTAHKQECYKEWNGISLPITEQIHNQELSLPISPVLTLAEAEEVVRVINRF